MRRRPSLRSLSEGERVERAAAALSLLEREVLALSAGDRLRNGEIARRLDISERRAERLLARAIYKISRAIERQQRDERKHRWWRLGRWNLR